MRAAGENTTEKKQGDLHCMPPNIYFGALYSAKSNKLLLQLVFNFLLW